ncbi:MAG: hypothetical protein JW940_02010, partial [Polyangiaceae bacterium]|nr:hypothetical protein [Polyangiaceae bacterium]
MTDRIPRDLFGRSSYRDRRNADLFFAELTGESPPASGIAARHPGRTEAVPHSEQAARGQDAGPEVWSDVEAAPVHPVFGAHEAWEQDIPWGEDEPEPTVTAGRNADEIIVTRADGSRYHVLRKVRAEVLTRPGRPRLGLCRDDKRVFLRVAWCEGTQAAIDAGANIPEALRNLLDTVAGQIQQGASPADIKQTFEQAQVQPFIELDITKIGDWKIAGDVKLDIDRSGIVSTTAQVSADKGWIKVGAQYQDDGSGKRVLATVDIPLGKRTVAGKKCPKRELAVWWDAECWREEPMTISTPGYRVSEETLFLYFEYATDVLRRDPKATQDSPDVI